MKKYLLMLFLCSINLFAFAQNKAFNIISFGAVADAKTISTKAIQKAIDACRAAGGGMVYVPAGT